jgi:hypothetical protein
MFKTVKQSILVIIILLCFGSCHKIQNKSAEWKPQDGYIPDSASAIKLAEIVWLNVYGSEINDEKPFKAKLKDGEIWIVEGTLNKYEFGGVAHIEIQRSDGKILKVIHGK